jgi:hypothetical protein
LFHRRRNERVKRRFACTFLVEGQRYRGFVVELSRSGLFLQTDATTSPGKEIELQLAATGAVPDMRLRGVVVRRRMVSTMLASVVRRGIAVEILEAPREYGLACGSALLDAPIRLSRAAEERVAGPLESGLQRPAAGAPRPRGEAHALQPPATVTSVEPPRSAAPAPPPAAEAAEAPRPEVLLLDDGTLGDVDALLRELGADALRLSLEAAGTAHPLPWPRRLFITTARIACTLPLPEPREDDASVSIAVADDESQTLSTMMRRLGFQYLVHRPIHPEAMRLLLRKLLYRGAEHRRAERHPFGTEVRWRSGWASHRGMLVEISSSGCRLLVDRPLPPGSRVRIEIAPETTGDRRISLRGRILRRDGMPAAAPDARHALAVGFDPLPARLERRLDALLDRLARGPATLAAGAAGPTPAPAPAVAPSPASEVEATATAPRVGERRRAGRARLDREVVALDGDAMRALHALIGRDLSPGGMRIDACPDLALGQRLRVALYEPSSASPIVLDAEIVRDDGGAGLGLRFVDVPADTSTRLEGLVAALPALERLRPEPERVWLAEFSSDASF